MRMYKKVSILILVFLIGAILAAADANAEHGRFGGLWMKNCKGKVGLGIIPSEGKSYFITFCGRGGCMPPTEDRPDTTVEDDPDYKVISDEHIQIFEDDGWNDYIKCRKI